MAEMESVERELELARKDLHEHLRGGNWLPSSLKVREDRCIELYRRLKALKAQDRAAQQQIKESPEDA